MRPKVFIGSSSAAIPIAEIAQAELANVAEAEVWTNAKFDKLLTPMENLFEALGEFHFALFVCLPEDITTKRGATLSTMRDNVLFEVGLFLGRLGRQQVFLIAPDQANISLSLPSDLIGIEPSFYDSTMSNLHAAIGASLIQMKQALRAFEASDFQIVFDSAASLKAYQFVFKGGKEYDVGGKPVSAVAAGNGKITNEAVEISRSNVDGRYEIEIRPNGGDEPSIARVPASDRVYEVRFEARVEAAPHRIDVVFADSGSNQWVGHESHDVGSHNWTAFASVMRARPGLDILVRLDDVVSTVPSGRLFLRNVSIRQFKRAR